MAAKKFTFRRQPAATGLASVARPWPATDVKLGGRVVGAIDPPSAWTRGGNNRWTIRFYVNGEEPGNPNCPWHNVRLARLFEGEAEAREFILANADLIQTKLDLHPMEE